jgi:hypothetical protein
LKGGEKEEKCMEGVCREIPNKKKSLNNGKFTLDMDTEKKVLSVTYASCRAVIPL